MLLLHNVSRKDSGLYKCVSTDTDTFLEVSGSMTLTVNCKDPAAGFLAGGERAPGL